MSFFTDLATTDGTDPHTSMPNPPSPQTKNPVEAPTYTTPHVPHPNGLREEPSNFRDENIFPSIFPAFPPQKLPLLAP